MDMHAVEMREARLDLQAADAELEAALAAIQAAKPTDNLTALEARFDAADRKYKASKAGFKVASRKAYEVSNASCSSTLAGARVTVREDLTYSQNGKHSFFRDMYGASRGDLEAAQRLGRHKQEIAVERPDARYDLNSTDATGGYLVPPLWLQDEFVTLARASSAVMNAIGPRPLPPNTDSINLPRMSTGTAVATQSDNSSVQETDAAFDTIAADVKTVAGLQDVSRQVVDRSIPGVDEVIFADLAKAYAVNVDTSVINSATANNLGLLQVSGINAITYTSATPTVPALYSKIADGVRQVHEGVFRPPTAIFMHPRRWAWILAAVDGQNRPLVVPAAQGPMNATGQFGNVVSEGLVGNVQGIPVYVDPNIPTTLGAGTNEDRIIICATDECFIWTAPDGPYAERFDDVGSGTLTVRFRLHSYWGQCHARRPKAISVVSGTGLSTVSF